MSKQNHNVVIVAHPDDETLFFGGLILRNRKRPWTVVCVTDGNGDGFGQKRMQQFKEATQRLGVKKIHMLNLPDRYNKRLGIDELKNLFNHLPSFHEVYTHNPIGEYGHPHHQDVAMATHEYYDKKNKITATAYNCWGDKILHLNEKEFKIKAKILSETYFSETQRLIQFLPATQTEHFTKFSLGEVRAIYDYIAYNIPLTPRELKKLKWFMPYLEIYQQMINRRPF